MDFNQSVSPSRQVIAQEVAGEMVLLDLESENYFGLDPVGTRVWQLIGECASMADILAAMLAEYDVEEPRLRADLTMLIEDAAQRGLVTLTPNGELAPSL